MSAAVSNSNPKQLPPLLLLCFPSWLWTWQLNSSDYSFWPSQAVGPVSEHDASHYQKESCFSCLTHPWLRKLEQVGTSTHSIWRHCLESPQPPPWLVLDWCPRLGYGLWATSQGIVCLPRAIVSPLILSLPATHMWSDSIFVSHLLPRTDSPGLTANFDAFIAFFIYPSKPSDFRQ